MSLELKPLIGKLNATCRKAFEGAAELCVNQGNYSVEIEHLLLKLLESSPNTDAQRIFRYYEIDPARLARELNQCIEQFKRGNTRTPTMSPYILALLKEAWLISSLHFGGESIRSGSIILATVDQDTLRGVLLESLPSLMRIPREALREDIRELVKGSAEDGGRATAKAAPVTAGQGEGGETVSPVSADTPALDQYTINLTEEARQGKIDPIEGRDGEIRQIVDILTRRRQNNPILTGEAGVGKTAVVEGFALRIARGDVPPALRDVVLRTLDLGLLQAGAGVKGEFENRIKSVISEVKNSPQPVILFIDEAHTMIGAGGNSGQGDAANLLKPALARGELRTIAATTWSEYKKYFEKDPALTRRFQVVKVSEPDEDTAMVMLRSVVAKLEAHHKVLILEEAVRDAVRLSHRYISGRQLPDKAVGVLDTACARVSIAQNSEPPVLEATRRRISRGEEELRLLRREQATGQPNHQPRIAELETEVARLEKLRDELQARWQRELEFTRTIRDLESQLVDRLHYPPEEEEEAEANRQKIAALQARLAQFKEELENLQQNDPMIPLCVDGHVVALVISGWTGIPVGKMLTDEIPTILDIQSKMAARLVGQDFALATLSRRIQTYRANLDDPGKPVGVFLLAGPSGVGKTETALTLAELLYGGEKNLITINMSEYQEAHTVSGLKGAPPGYVGHGKGGVLTEAVRRNPYSVVLLDEVEKAHADVLELFYQVFDKGSLEDGDGVGVDFRNTLILLTTNVGTETINTLCRHGQLPEFDVLQEQVRQELLRYFKPAFLGRLVVVPYYPLGEEQIRAIVHLKLGKIAQRFQENHRAQLSYDDDLVAAILARCTEADSGARNIDHILTHTLLPALSVEILQRMAREEGFSRVHLTQGEDGDLLYQFDSAEPALLAEKAGDADTPGNMLGDLDSLLDWLKSS